jgi:hypothetical protein
MGEREGEDPLLEVRPELFGMCGQRRSLTLSASTRRG